MGKKAAIDLKFKELEVADYERVIEVKEEGSGLHGIIAIHNTKLGPALGGIRAYPYASFDQGLNDALRLAKGMTYKASVAQTGTGGGKSVIFLDNRNPKPEELLHAFGEAINMFKGEYIGAEDLGMPITDLQAISKRTRYLVGLPAPQSSGDPSRFTAFGGYRGIQAVSRYLWGSDSLAGRTFAIQGLGSVGMKIAEHLFWEGARLIVTDVNSKLIEKAVREFGATGVNPQDILSTKCDVLVPCALGGIINPKTISELQCQAVAGLANNQLLSGSDGDALYQKGILYAPDYVINAGGLLTVCVELEPEGFEPDLARKYTDRIYDVLLGIFSESGKEKLSTHRVADKLAEENVRNGIGKRTLDPVFRDCF